MKCKTCGREIKVSKVINGGYAVSCGNIDCMNIGFCDTIEEAKEYAKGLSE